LIAEHLELGALMIRKPGKLPGELIEKNYELEYGTNSLSIQKKDLKDKSVVIVDDLLATGGSMKCSKELLESLGAKVVGGSVVIELKSLNGSSKLDIPITSLISYAD
jgi:adenine phosphoribosyltransferase